MQPLEMKSVEPKEESDLKEPENLALKGDVTSRSSKTKDIIRDPESNPNTKSAEQEELDHMEKEARSNFATRTLLNHPGVCCGCIFILVLTSLFIMMNSVSLTEFSTREYFVWDDIRVQRNDVVNLAKEDLNTEIYGDNEVPLRIDDQSRWQTFVMYRANNSDNVITYENIKIVRRVEEQITALEGYPRLCQAVSSDDSSCAPYDSVVPFFKDAKNQQDVVDTVDELVDTDYDSVKMFFETSFSKTNRRSKWTRTNFRFATPIFDGHKRYKSSDDDFDGQKEYLIDLYYDIDDIISESESDDLEIFLYSSIWWGETFGNLMLQDFKFVILSIAFVLVYMSFHTWTFFYPFVGMIEIVSSFPLAYVIYRYVLFVKLFNVMTLLSIFIILGIAADDIFVFLDAWKQAGNIPLLQKDFDKRFSYVYRRASKAMFVTTITTFFAFLATAVSDVAPLAAFGLFSANLIMSNYVLVISYFPIAVIFKEKYFRNWWEGLKSRQRQKQSGEPHLDNRKIQKKHSSDGLMNFPTPLKNGADVASPENERVVREDKDCSGHLISTSKKSQGLDACLPSIESERNPQNLDSIDATVGSKQSTCHQPPRESKVERFFETRMTDFLHKFRYVFMTCFLLWIPVGIYMATEIPPLSELERWFPEDHDIEIAIDMHLEGFHQGEEDGKITVELIYGIDGLDRSNLTLEDRYDPTSIGEIDWDKEFNLSPKANQLRLLQICEELRSNTRLVRDGFVKCFIDDMRLWLEDNDREFPVESESFVGTVQEFLDAPEGDSYVTKRLVGIWDQWLQYVSIRAISQGTVGSYSEMHPLWREWEDLMEEFNKNSPVGIKNGFESSFSWQLMVTERALLRNAFEGMAIAGGVSLIVLLISTGNYLVALYAIFSIAGIVISVLALVYMLGWEFGMVISMAVVMLIGFSVDYTVHVCHAYVESIQESRLEKTRETLKKMGVSIFGGAITTFGTGAVLFMTTLVFFINFAWVITGTIAFSLMWSLLFLPSVLMVIGPEGKAGNLQVIASKVKDRFKKIASSKK